MQFVVARLESEKNQYQTFLALETPDLKCEILETKRIKKILKWLLNLVKIAVEIKRTKNNVF